MKKLLLWMVAACAVVLSACREDKAIPEEKALSNYLADSLLKISRYTTGSYEMGYQFYTITNGWITQLGIRMPEAGSYQVSLWDVETKTLITQKKLNQTLANTLTLESLSPAISTTANKKYLISVNNANKPYFVASGRSKRLNFLPFTKGHITFVESCYYNGPGSGIPNTALKDELYGFPEIAFVAEE